MNEEIKQILDNTIEYLEGIDETRNTKILTTNETNILLDYITNLQEENEKLNLELSGYREAILRDDKLLGLKDYKLRCKKAIKYIKKNTREYKLFNTELGHFSNLTNISIDKNNKVFIDDLLKILGGDEEC